MTYARRRAFALNRISSIDPSARCNLFFEGGSSEDHAVVAASTLVVTRSLVSESEVQRDPNASSIALAKPISSANDEKPRPSSAMNSRISYSWSVLDGGMFWEDMLVKDRIDKERKKETMPQARSFLLHRVNARPYPHDLF